MILFNYSLCFVSHVSFLSIFLIFLFSRTQSLMGSIAGDFVDGPRRASFYHARYYARQTSAILRVEDYARASCAGKILCPNAMCGVMPVSPAPIYYARYYARASGAGKILCAADFEPGMALMK